ncbi:hypothetical protein POVWA1_004200 [Plasmodium ovale wallikeri]|uniref:Uncharacterized protein n=1 Tax=Plasmodium ovale wallikeri TaxID=864142 RepID=A0A1A8YH19_PLAOA|nr:hypothetical protein POVWA1_004200 [Plasmodium ovale wallikeri]
MNPVKCLKIVRRGKVGATQGKSYIDIELPDDWLPPWMCSDNSFCREMLPIETKKKKKKKKKRGGERGEI